MERFLLGHAEAAWWFLLSLLGFCLLLWGSRSRARNILLLVPGWNPDAIKKSLQHTWRTCKALLLVSVLFFSAIAMLEPKYDFTYETINRKGIDLFIALDVSKSMYGTDIAPTRFDRSILEIKNLVNNLTDDRIGLILFTSQAITQCPLTLDYATFKLFLDDVSIGMLPRGGTSIAAAILQSVKSFDRHYKKERVLVLISDGESHKGDLDAALHEAKLANVTIYTVGLGSVKGVPVLLPSLNGEKTYIKDDKGNIVLSRLNDILLKKTALRSGGAYIHATGSSFSLEKIYQQYIAPLVGRDLEMNRKKIYKHRFYLPLGLAFLLLLLETWLPEKKRTKGSVATSMAGKERVA